MHGLGLALEQVAEVHGKHVHDAHACVRRDDGRQGLEVRVVLVRGQENELANAGGLPGVEQVVQCAMQRLASQRGVAGVRPLCGHVHAILERGCAQHAELR